MAKKVDIKGQTADMIAGAAEVVKARREAVEKKSGLNDGAKSEKITVRLTKGQHEALKEIAAEEGRTVGGMVAYLVLQEIKKRKE